MGGSWGGACGEVDLPDAAGERVVDGGIADGAEPRVRRRTGFRGRGMGRGLGGGGRTHGGQRRAGTYVELEPRGVRVCVRTKPVRDQAP